MTNSLVCVIVINTKKYALISSIYKIYINIKRSKPHIFRVLYNTYYFFPLILQISHLFPPCYCHINQVFFPSFLASRPRYDTRKTKAKRKCSVLFLSINLMRYISQDTSFNDTSLVQLKITGI
jgi:hypothetical protein